MEGMGLIFTPVIGRDVSYAIQACSELWLELWLALLGLIAIPSSRKGGFNLPPASHPSPPLALLPPTHPL